VIGVRICRSKYTQLDGERARRVGGRWNSLGVPVVYMASSLSLSILEILVNLGRIRDLDDYILLTAEFDQDLITDIDDQEFPTVPDGSKSQLYDLYGIPRARTQRLGDDWVQDPHRGILSVPSAVLPGRLEPAPKERIYVFSPRLIEAGRVVLRTRQSFRFDPRLNR
jgi:RES domain-containing protein